MVIIHFDYFLPCLHTADINSTQGEFNCLRDANGAPIIQSAFFDQLAEDLESTFGNKICSDFSPDETSLKNLTDIGCNVIVIYNDEREKSLDRDSLTDKQKLNGKALMQSERLSAHGAVGKLLTFLIENEVLAFIIHQGRHDEIGT